MIANRCSATAKSAYIFIYNLPISVMGQLECATVEACEKLGWQMEQLVQDAVLFLLVGVVTAIALTMLFERRRQSG